jgi:cytochrome b subunit of formate dehydrogenase
LALITPVYLKAMCDKSKLFRESSLEIGKTLFGVNTLLLFFKKLEAFIKILKLPTKYTDFKQINKITKEDINWLTKHYSIVNENGKNGPKTKFAYNIFNAIKQ